MTIINSLLVYYKDGNFLYEDPASIATYGKFGSFISLGDVPYEEAYRRAQAIVAANSAPNMSITAEVNPRTATEVPKIGYELLDRVSFPSMRTGDPAEHVVRAYTIAHDEVGFLRTTVELEGKQSIEEELAKKQLERFSHGSMGGRSGSASPLPDEFDGVFATGKIGSTQVTFSWSGPLIPGPAVDSGPIAIEGRGRLTMIRSYCMPGATSSSGLVLYRSEDGISWTVVQGIVLLPSTVEKRDPVSGQFVGPMTRLRIATPFPGGHVSLSISIDVAVPAL